MTQPWDANELIPIRDRVYSYIKNAILKGEYKTGDRLIERELAEKLNISRTPIREALFRLESQGFVKTVPRKGVVVSEITHRDILEVFMILSSLEVLAVKLAAEKMNEQTQQKFDELIERIDRVLDGAIEEDINELHLEINDVLHKAAKSPKLYELLVELVDYIRAFAHLGYELPGRMEQAMKEHRDIMSAVRNKEMEMAEYLTKIHIENSKKAYIDATRKDRN